jgi:F-type H+-transporting ATPase subunit b
MELLKLLSANEIVAQTAAFLILLWILRRVFWNKFLKALDDRRDRISSEYRKADDVKAEAERIRSEYASQLAAIEETGRLKIQDAIHEGRRVADEMRENASKESEKIVENAKITIKAELSKAKEELKDRVADLVIETAEKVMQEKLTEDEDRRMVEFFLKETAARK